MVNQSYLMCIVSTIPTFSILKANDPKLVENTLVPMTTGLAILSLSICRELRLELLHQLHISEQDCGKYAQSEERVSDHYSISLILATQKYSSRKNLHLPNACINPPYRRLLGATRYY